MSTVEVQAAASFLCDCWATVIAELDLSHHGQSMSSFCENYETNSIIDL